jgi:thioredoxin-related protein
MKIWSILFLITLLAGCTRRQPPLITGFEGKPLPAFNLLQMDSTTRLNTSSIPTGKPIVLFLFSPYCPYCRAQTEDMVKHIKKMEDIQVYMLSAFPFSTLKDYYDQYHLSQYPNITMVQDYESYFANYYKAPGVPFIAIYNKDKMLKEVLMGNVGVKSIASAVSE